MQAWTPPFEWATIVLPLDVRFPNGEWGGLTDVTGQLVRTDEHALALIIEGNGRADLPRRPAGKLLDGADLLAATRDGVPLRTSGLIAVHVQNNMDFAGTRSRATVRAKVSAAGTGSAPATGGAIIEWLCNVPQSLFWPDSTKRESHFVERRMRPGEAQEDSQKTSSVQRDHISIELDSPHCSSVRFGVVPPEVAPSAREVADPGFLLFEPGVLGTPDDALRHTIRCALRALFGCGLGVVAYSEFDAEMKLARCTVTNVHSPGGGIESAPVILGSPSRQDVDRDLCSQFVRAYVKLARTFALNRVTWLWRQSLVATLDMSPAYAGVAFEVLRRRYYKQPGNSRRIKHLNPGDWKKIRSGFSEVLALAARRGVEAEPLEQIRKSLDWLNDISLAQQNFRFLDDLGLHHGAMEASALKARNEAAHGAAFEPGDEESWLARTAALRTLVSRALFRVLNVEPPAYNDYGARGFERFPTRRLSDAQGVPAWQE